MEDKKPAYKSKGVIGSAVALAAFGAQLIGLEITPADQAQLNDLILSAIGIAGAALGLVGRILASRKIG